MRLKDDYCAVRFHKQKDLQENFVKKMLSDKFHLAMVMQGFGENDWIQRAEAMENIADSRKQKIYYVSQKVQDHAKMIKFEKIELDWFKRMGTKHATYILNKDEFYRFWINEGKSIHIGYFKNTVLDEFSDINQPVKRLWFEFKVFVIRFGENSWMPAIDTIDPEIQEAFVRLLLFIEMAEISIKVVEPNQRIKIDNLVGGKGNNKFLNESGLTVIYVDTNWNKTLYVHGVIKVTGHFRMQPYGQRVSPNYKLIYVDDYKKQGYTKRAGSLNEGSGAQ